MDNIRKIKVLGVIVLALLGWSGSAAATSACLKGAALNKLCLDVSSVPATSVQPSRLAGTDTFVRYTASIRNLVSATSRNIALTLTVNPAPASAMTFTADAGVACSVSGATLSCLADKIAGVDPLNITLVAEAPRHPTTATEMVNTGVVGWNGNTSTLTHVVGVSTTAAESWIPPDTEVTLVNEEETADPADQTTPEDPLFAKVTFPPRPHGYFAKIAVITDGPSSAADCVGGIYASPLYGGGPYVCRDTGTPTRWVHVDADAYFTPESPLDYQMLWDASIVPALQLPPNEAASTGLPLFAIFYNQTDTAVPYGPTRAFSNVCDELTPVAPCIVDVAQLSSGDWSARFLKPNDGSDMQDPLAPLAALLNFLLNAANALPGLSLGPVAK